MAYINKLKNYHPSDILRQKRAKRFETKEVDVPATVEVAGAEKAKEPEDAQDTLIKQTQEYLVKVSEGITTILSKISDLNEVAEKAAKSSITDIERKAVIKDFLQKRTALDQFSATTLVNGEPIFSGKLEMKGKILKIDTDKEMELKIKSFDTKGLGIDRSRIDSSAVADKTKLELEQAKNIVTSTRTLVDQALNQIENKLRTKEMAEKLAETVKNPEKTESYLLRDLRRRQEGLAETYGQTFGLLLNIKV